MLTEGAHEAPGSGSDVSPDDAAPNAVAPQEQSATHDAFNSPKESPADESSPLLFHESVSSNSERAGADLEAGAAAAPGAPILSPEASSSDLLAGGDAVTIAQKTKKELQKEKEKDDPVRRARREKREGSEARKRQLEGKLSGQAANGKVDARSTLAEAGEAQNRRYGLNGSVLCGVLVL